MTIHTTAVAIPLSHKQVSMKYSAFSANPHTIWLKSLAFFIIFILYNAVVVASLPTHLSTAIFVSLISSSSQQTIGSYSATKRLYYDGLKYWNHKEKNKEEYKRKEEGDKNGEWNDEYEDESYEDFDEERIAQMDLLYDQYIQQIINIYGEDWQDEWELPVSKKEFYKLYLEYNEGRQKEQPHVEDEQETTKLDEAISHERFREQSQEKQEPTDHNEEDM